MMEMEIAYFRSYGGALSVDLSHKLLSPESVVLTQTIHAASLAIGILSSLNP